MTDLSADAAALRRACLLDPADHVPRLLWADALEEAGDAELAAFVRRDVALAQGDGGEAGMAEAFADVKDRYATVPAAYAVRNRVAFHDGAYDMWRDGDRLARIPADTRAVLLVRAGMGAALRTTRGWFAAHAAEVFAAQPVTSVVLTDAAPRTRSSVSGLDDTGQAGWWRYDPLTHYPLAAEDLDPPLVAAAWALVEAVAGPQPAIYAKNWLWTRDAAAALAAKARRTRNGRPGFTVGRHEAILGRRGPTPCSTGTPGRPSSTGTSAGGTETTCWRARPPAGPSGASAANSPAYPTSNPVRSTNMKRVVVPRSVVPPDAAVDLALSGQGVLAYVYDKSLTVLGRDCANGSIYFRPVGCCPANSVHALSTTSAELVAKITDSVQSYAVEVCLFDTPAEMFEWAKKNDVTVR